MRIGRVFYQTHHEEPRIGEIGRERQLSTAFHRLLQHFVGHARIQSKPMMCLVLFSSLTND